MVDDRSKIPTDLADTGRARKTDSSELPHGIHRVWAPACAEPFSAALLFRRIARGIEHLKALSLLQVFHHPSRNEIRNPVEIRLRLCHGAASYAVEEKSVKVYSSVLLCPSASVSQDKEWRQLFGPIARLSTRPVECTVVCFCEEETPFAAHARAIPVGIF